MRIAIVSPEFPPEEGGGGGVVVEQLARDLSNRHQVLVLFGSRERRFTKSLPSLELKPIPLIRFSRSASRTARNLPPTFNGIRDIVRSLSSFNPDIVHLHGMGHMMVDVAGIACRILGIPYISIVHGVPLTANRSRTLRWAYGTYTKLIGLPVLRSSGEVIAVSGRVGKILTGNGVQSSRIHVAYPTIQLKPERQDIDFRAAFGISNSKKILLCIGSLAYRKGTDLALRAASHLLKVRNDFVLCLIGNDEGFQRDVEAKIVELGLSSHVRILGRLTHALKEAALQECSLVVVPSRDEPFGLVPVEAIAHNKPVLISIHSGVSELIRVPQLMFDPMDSKSFADKIDGLLNNSSRSAHLVDLARDSLGQNAWADTVSLYETMSICSTHFSR